MWSPKRELGMLSVGNPTAGLRAAFPQSSTPAPKGWLLVWRASPCSIFHLQPSSPWLLLTFCQGLTMLSLCGTWPWSRKPSLEHWRINKEFASKAFFLLCPCAWQVKAIFPSLVTYGSCIWLCGTVSVAFLLCFSSSLHSIVQIPSSSGLF